MKESGNKKFGNKKAFILKQGASCDNKAWRCWSFINKAKRFVIFGAWDYNIDTNKTLILDEDCRMKNGHRFGPMKLSKEHLKLVHEEEYRLKIFIMFPYDNGKSGMKDFDTELTEKKLQKEGNKWYAVDFVFQTADEIENPQEYYEGATKQVFVNSYERNPEARRKCLEKHGYKCAACKFDFKQVYGEIGKEYIHVHHKIPLSEIKKEYKVNPTEDLIPVCPNCHAMIHRNKEYLTVEELKKLIKK